MPEIPLGGGHILKPAAMGLKVGNRISFQIKGPHTVTASKNADAKPMYNIPVEQVGGQHEGDFPLNVTNRTSIAGRLGTNTDLWVGGRFDAVVVPQRDPNTGQSVLGWSVVQDSVQPPPQTPANPGQPGR